MIVLSGIFRQKYIVKHLGLNYSRSRVVTAVFVRRYLHAIIFWFVEGVASAKESGREHISFVWLSWFSLNILLLIHLPSQVVGVVSACASNLF